MFYLPFFCPVEKRVIGKDLFRLFRAYPMTELKM